MRSRANEPHSVTFQGTALLVENSLQLNLTYILYDIITG